MAKNKLIRDWYNIMFYLAHINAYHEVDRNIVEQEIILHKNDGKCREWFDNSIPSYVYTGGFNNEGNFTWSPERIHCVEPEDYDTSYIIDYEVLYKGKKIFNKESLKLVVGDIRDINGNSFEVGDVIWRENSDLNRALGAFRDSYGPALMKSIIKDYNITEEVLIDFVKKAHKKKKEKNPNFKTYWELYYSEFLDDFENSKEDTDNLNKQYSLKK